MNGNQLLNSLRYIKKAAETEIGAICDLSLFVDRESKQGGLVIEIKHLLGRYMTDGLTYHLILGESDDLLNPEKLSDEVVAWIREQREDYAKLLSGDKGAIGRKGIFIMSETIQEDLLKVIENSYAEKHKFGEGDALVYHEELYTMIILYGVEVFTALETIIKNKLADVYLLMEALSYLGTIDETDFLPYQIQLFSYCLDHPSNYIRYGAINALCGIAHVDTLDRLKEAHEKEDSRMLKNILKQLIDYLDKKLEQTV